MSAYLIPIELCKPMVEYGRGGGGGAKVKQSQHVVPNVTFLLILFYPFVCSELHVLRRLVFRFE